jgi:hypothetical protein
MADFVNLDTSKAVFFSADQARQLKITNTTNTTIYYDDTSAASSGTNDGNLTQGQSATFSTGVYVRPIANAQIIVEYFAESRVADLVASDDLTIGDDATIADTLTVTGATTLTGGIAGGTAPLTRHRVGPFIQASTDGTNTTPGTTTVYLTQFVIPYNCTLTGAAMFNGSDATDSVILALFNDSGTPVANTSIGAGDTQQTGTDAFQEIAFTSTYAAKGPKTYWLGAYFDGTTSRFNTIPTGLLGIGQAGLCGSVGTQVYGTVAAITLPTTQTADKGIFGYVY